MTVKFIPVTTEEDINYLARLAYNIWNEYWPDRIGQAQTDYMLEKFHSVDAMKRDMAENDYEYWFICETDDDNETGTPNAADNGAPMPLPASVCGRLLGYTGGHVEPETNRYFISKVYLLAAERGHGFASQTIAFYDDLCRSRGLDAMYLTVNKDNDLGIRAYEGKGFVTIDATETDIGEGFIMDDYIMEKPVEATSEK